MRKGTKLERPQTKETTSRFPRGEKQPYTPDTLLDNINPALTDDQLFYIIAHPLEKRSVMAKKLQLPKVQLNFVLERLRSG